MNPILNPDCQEVWSTIDPYIVRVFHPFLKLELFSELRSEFPDIRELRTRRGVGYKHGVSDGKRGGFRELIEHRPSLAYFHNAIVNRALLKFARRHFNVLRGASLKQRVELSLLPSNGGHVRPHPDMEKKLVTLVIYLADDDWNASWGGEFAMVKPLVPVDTGEGYRISFDDVVVVHKVPFKPNIAVFMERSPCSFHAVYPIRAPEGRHRKSITINFMGRPR